MHFTALADESGLLLAACEGDIRMPAPGADNDPLAALLGADGYARKVLLNLERAGFIDSSGIGWLVACQKRFLQAGGMLVLHSIPPLVLQTLKLMRMEKVLHLADHLAAARALALKGQP